MGRTLSYDILQFRYRRITRLFHTLERTPQKRCCFLERWVMQRQRKGTGMASSENWKWINLTWERKLKVERRIRSERALYAIPWNLDFKLKTTGSLWGIPCREVSRQLTVPQRMDYRDSLGNCGHLEGNDQRLSWDSVTDYLLS